MAINREKKKVNCNNFKFSIFTFIGSFLLVLINMFYDFVKLFQNPNFVVICISVVIFVIFAVCAVLAIRECYTFYQSNQPYVPKWQPQNEEVEESNSESKSEPKSELNSEPEGR